MAARGFLGAGDLYIARYEGGVFLDYEGPFECTKFEIKPNVELKELVSKGRFTYGQVIESVPVPRPADLTVELSEVNKQSLAIALLGTTVALSQTAGTFSNEAVTSRQGFWRPLTKVRMTEGSVVVTNVAGTTTYVAGVDYIINYSFGWIKTLAGGAIADATVVHVDAAYGLVTGTEIKGATQAQVRAKFKLDGINFADDLPVITTVHEAVVAADSAFDFLADDFAAVTLPGRMKTPAGFIEPFTVHLRNA